MPISFQMYYMNMMYTYSIYIRCILQEPMLMPRTFFGVVVGGARAYTGGGSSSSRSRSRSSSSSRSSSRSRSGGSMLLGWPGTWNVHNRLYTGHKSLQLFFPETS